MSPLGMLAVIGLVAAAAGCGSDENQPATSDGGGPITVEQLLARSADAPVAVQGLLHVDQDNARLCAAILESYPPQCGEPSVELADLDLSAVQGTTTAEGITWKEGAVLNLQRAADGRFTVVGADSLTTQVVLGLYSGVPDPEWTLTAEQVDEFNAALAALTVVDEVAPSGGLGYHGFTIVTPNGAFVAYAGRVASLETDPPVVRDDPGRTIEHLLVDTAGAHVTSDELTIVTQALEQR